MLEFSIMQDCDTCTFKKVDSMNTPDNLVKPRIATEFFDSWATYQKIIANNYMKHHELFAKLGELLNSLSAESSFKFLDVGCGDAFYSAQTLSCLPSVEYFGIDSSAQALHEAKKNLANNKISQASLIFGDLSIILDEMVAKPQKFNVILSSFCLHHYQTAEKLAIYSKIKNILAENGVFVIIDIFRTDAQNRHDYLTHTMGDFYRSLSNLSQNEIINIREHVESSDYPNTHFETQEAILSQGFTEVGSYFSLEHYAIYCAK